MTLTRTPGRRRVTKAAPNLPRQQFVPVRQGLTADEQELAAAVHEAIGKLQTSAGGNDVLAQLFGGNWKDAIDKLDWDGWDTALGRAKVLLAEHYAASLAATLAVVAPDLTVLTAHSMPYAAQAAKSAGQRIVGITDRTREGIADVIEKAVNDGWSMDRIGVLLRDAVGLTPGQALQVKTFEEGLFEDGTTPGVVSNLVAGLRDALGDARAKTIARYETQTAMNDGRHAAWNAAVLHGSIGADATKQWVAGDDPCPECEELDDEEADLNDEFSDGELMPPDHPSCRCTAIISDVGTPADSAGGDGQ